MILPSKAFNPGGSHTKPEMTQATPPPSGPVDATERRLRTLSSIVELTTDLLHVEDMSTFLQRVVETVRSQFGFDRVSISIADVARGIFTDHALAGYPPDVANEVRSNREAFELESILEDFRDDCRISKLAYYVPVEKQEASVENFVAVKSRDAATKPRVSPDSWHELDLLYFALYNRRGTVIGFMQADYPLDGRVPSRQTIEEVELYASIAAVAIENSEVYKRSIVLAQENEVKNERMMKILELIQSVLRIDDVDAVLQKVSDAMAFTFGFRKAGVSLFSEHSNKVVIHSLTGYSPDETNAVLGSTILRDKVLEDFREEFRVTKIGYFIPGETQQSVSDFVFLEDSKKAMLPRLTPDSWHELDLLYFGIYDRKGRMLGYVQLDYPVDGKIPAKETMEAMEAFAAIAAIAIENSAIFKDLTQARDQVKMYLDLLAHDIGNLVNPIDAYLEIVLSTTSLTPVQEKYIKSAVETTRNIMHLIRNVRRSAQMIESDQVELVPINLTRALSQGASDAGNAFLAKKVNIKLNLPPQDMWVVADGFLDEVVYNLLTNSVKYDEHDEVAIDVDAKAVEVEGKSYFHVKFMDRGCGIPDDLKDKVFSKDFRKISRSERPGPAKAKGAGMGLSIVKSLIERYRGRIWIENRVYDDYTRGSVFNILLPTP